MKKALVQPGARVKAPKTWFDLSPSLQSALYREIRDMTAFVPGRAIPVGFFAIRELRRITKEAK